MFTVLIQKNQTKEQLIRKIYSHLHFFSRHNKHLHYSIIAIALSIIAGVILAYLLDQITGAKSLVISGVCILFVILCYICIEKFEKAYKMNQVSPHAE